MFMFNFEYVTAEESVVAKDQQTIGLTVETKKTNDNDNSENNRPSLPNTGEVLSFIFSFMGICVVYLIGYRIYLKKGVDKAE